MARWEHEVRVVQGPLDTVRLLCACRWESPPLTSPTVSSLAQIAQDHRRQGDTEPERCRYYWATERCPMPAGHTGRHIFDTERSTP